VDIIERLLVERDIGCATRSAREVMADAANEIQRLQGLLQMSYPDQMAEIERLREMYRKSDAENDELRADAFKHAE